jgi:pimeloyl-ACP methyl ester carboxylesterase
VRAVAVVDPAFGADEHELAGCPAQFADLRRRGAEAAAEFVDRACDPRRVPALWRDARRQMLATSGEVLAGLYRSMYLDDGAIGGRTAAAACLERLRVPVLALYSNGPAATWARSLALPPGSRVLTWPGRSHYLHQEDPAAFCELLLTAYA